MAYPYPWLLLGNLLIIVIVILVSVRMLDQLRTNLTIKISTLKGVNRGL